MEDYMDFWRPMRVVQSILLRPFAAIYHLVTALRNTAYDKGWLRSFGYTLPVISVGNLKVGGTGKTPMVEYITNALLELGSKPAIVSRGYKRKSRGYVLADEQSTARSIGDEPFQYYRKWLDKVVVVVAEDRSLAIPQLLYDKPKTDCIVLDDAFQHRRVRPEMNIVLTEFGRPFYEDFILPAGLLRESREGAKRADVIIVTKCPEGLHEHDIKSLKKGISQYTNTAPVYFTTVNYGRWQPLIGEHQVERRSKAVLVTGIASADSLTAHLKDQLIISKHFDFQDHHNYSSADIKSIVKHLSRDDDTMLVTTEKDAVKLSAFENELKDHSCAFVPIEVKFLVGEDEFIDQLEKTISRFD